MKNKIKIKNKIKKFNKITMKHKIIRIKIIFKQNRIKMRWRQNFNLINKIMNNKF